MSRRFPVARRYDADSAFRSDSTIMSTSPSKATEGVQPSLVWAFVESAQAAQLRVALHVVAPVQVEALERLFGELADAVAFAAADYVVVRVRRLEHHVHSADVVRA